MKNFALLFLGLSTFAHADTAATSPEAQLKDYLNASCRIIITDELQMNHIGARVHKDEVLVKYAQGAHQRILKSAKEALMPKAEEIQKLLLLSKTEFEKLNTYSLPTEGGDGTAQNDPFLKEIQRLYDSAANFYDTLRKAVDPDLQKSLQNSQAPQPTTAQYTINQSYDDIELIVCTGPIDIDRVCSRLSLIDPNAKINLTIDDIGIPSTRAEYAKSFLSRRETRSFHDVVRDCKNILDDTDYETIVDKVVSDWTLKFNDTLKSQAMDAAYEASSPGGLLAK